MARVAASPAWANLIFSGAPEALAVPSALSEQADAGFAFNNDAVPNVHSSSDS
jgi:hypothetical protein